MRDVYLLTEGDEGPIAVPHLELTFMDKGLELDKPNGEAVWNTAWSDLEEMSPVERSVLPDGSEGVVMLVVERSGRRRHSLVLATSDAAATEAAIRGRARAHGVETNRSRRAASRALNVVIVLVAAVVMTALLLQAAHVIHF